MCRERPKRRRIASRSSVPRRSRSMAVESTTAGSVAMPVRSAVRSWRSISVRSSPARAPCFALELAEHGPGADEVVVEDAPGHVEQLPDRAVADGVADGRALLAGGHDVLAAQHGELLRHRGLVDAERGLQLLHAVVAGSQDLQDADTERVSQGLEELRLEPLQLVRRARRHRMKISSYCNISQLWSAPDPGR